jgi:hypothetical protein
MHKRLTALSKADLANPNLNDRAVRMLGKERTLLASCGGSYKVMQKVISLLRTNMDV